MCGIFGIVTGDGSRLRGAPLRRAVGDLFGFSESRGMESAGIAVRAGDVVRLLRSPQSASRLMTTPQYRTVMEHADRATGPVAIIGHSRMATNGAPGDNR